MSNQILISSGAKLRDLDDVIIGTDGVLTSLGFNVANGVPKLDENGKILVSQLPNSVMEFKGVWNAATNTPTLANGTGNAGDVWLCNVAGTVNFGAGPIAFAVGDYAVYTGTVWARSSGATGTVTSVGLSRSGDALTVTGSPITTSGTINIGFAGTNLQYINGAGNLVTFPTIAQEAQRLITEVYNETGATLAKGSIVYINGGHGNLPTVTKAIATGDATSAQTYGIVQNDIGNNNNGFVVIIGSLTDLDTQAYPEGTQLYLSGTTAGAWTSTKPYAPVHLVYVAIVTRSHPTQGVVEVSIQNGYEMDELHNVAAQNPDNNDILQYKTSTSLWTKVAGTTSNIAEGSNLYFTDARARQSISLTTTGSTGASTYDNVTGVLNIPNYVDQYVGTVTSVGLSAPTGFSVTGSPVTSSGTLALAFAAGYSLPTNVKQSNWDDAYTWVAAFPTQTGNAGKFLTTDGSSLSWAANPLGTVTSVAMSVPTGLTVTGSPITTNGTLAVTLTSGYVIPTQAALNGYFPYSGGTFTGSINLLGSQFYEVTGVYGLNADNSDIIGLNGLYFNDNAESGGEGINFWRSSGYWDTLRAEAGVLYFTPNRASGTAATSYTIWTTQNLPNPIIGTGTADYIPKFTASGTISNSTIRNEGIYVAINGATNSNGMLSIYNDGAFALQFINNGIGGATWQIGPTNNAYGAGAGKFVFTYGTSSLLSLLTLTQATGNISIGSTTDVSRLYVEGIHTAGRGIITANSSDTAYLHLSSSSTTATDVGVRLAKSNSEKWVFGMVGGSSSTDYTFRLLGAGLSTNVFNVNISTGVTAYNYALNGTSASFSSSVTANSFVKIGGTSAQYLMADGSVTTGGGGGSQWIGVSDIYYNIGNVSIGSSSTPVKLYLNGSHTSGRGIFEINSTNDALIALRKGSATSGLRLQNSSGGEEWMIGTNNAGEFNILEQFDVTKTRFYIQNTSGNIGINTAAPSLSQTGGGLVVSAINSTANVGFRMNGGTGGWAYQEFYTNASAKFILGYRDADGLFHLNYGNSLSDYGGLSMNSGNRIALGANNFTGLLTISGNHPSGYGMLRIISGDAALIDLDAATRDCRLRHKYNGSDVWFAGTYDNDSYKWQSASVFAMTLTQAGLLTVTAQVYAQGFYESSDARLKTLVEDNYLLSSIANVKARLYIKDGRKELGYYAQDLESILPSAVTEGSNGFLNLSYAQVHTAKIAVIEDKVTILENEVAELKNKLQKYEA